MDLIDKKILKLLEKNARLSNEDIAVVAEISEAEAGERIARLEKDGVIRGYKGVIDWERVDPDRVSAIIELKVTPQRDGGYDRVAEKIYNYPEVKDMYLMSGGFDFTVIIEGKSMKEVALFVAEKLACADGVLSTATHFVLRKYKTEGVIHGAKARVDEREKGFMI